MSEANAKLIIEIKNEYFFFYSLKIDISISLVPNINYNIMRFLSQENQRVIGNEIVICCEPQWTNFTANENEIIDTIKVGNSFFVPA